MSKLPNNWEKTLDDDSQLYIFTDRNLLDTSFINNVLASEDCYWAERLKAEDAELMLDNSLTFGLYVRDADSKSDSLAKAWPGKADLKQIGLARLITDRTTFAYLTDVYVAHGYRGLGLGRWLMSCVQETVDAMSNLRRIVLLTSGGGDKSVEGNVGTKIRFYQDTLGMSVFQGSKGLVCMSRRGKAHARMGK